jgi:hypothetical protein
MLTYGPAALSRGLFNHATVSCAARLGSFIISNQALGECISHEEPFNSRGSMIGKNSSQHKHRPGFKSRKRESLQSQEPAGLR